MTFSENPFKLGWPHIFGDHWDPFFAACEDEGTIICLHIGSSSTVLAVEPGAPIDIMITLTPLNTMHAATDLVWSQVLRKFPNLQFALSEGGTGWIPYWLERLDYTYQQHKYWTGQDFGDKLPSEVAREHFSFCFISDRTASTTGTRSASTRSRGSATTRTPTPRGRHSPEALAKQLDGVPDDEVAKITHENAMRIYSVRPVRAPPEGAEHGRRAARRGPTTSSAQTVIVAELGHEPGAGQQADRTRLLDVDDHGIAGLPPDDEGHHAVVARVGALHPAVVTVDPHATDHRTGV